MKLFVSGREGQLARSLLALSAADVDVVAIGRPELDITDRASIERALDAHKPDIVVNAAAYTAVDRAESERDQAFAINRDGAENVALAAAEAGLPVIHVSTDYVFSGSADGWRHEQDPTGPQNVYGASKLAGEQAVAAANPAHAILRTAWVYSPYGGNFLKTMLRLAGDRERVGVVADQFGTPTYAPDIAEAILVAARAIVADPQNSDLQGVFHLTAQGEANWADFAREIFRQSAARGGPSAAVDAITTADYPTPARRPANSRLDTTRFATSFGHKLPDWRDGVARCLAALGD
ncbi:dTDP-4-dehydrorhamnose reductase [Pseudochelatococcus contaminans]|uniref:dTDP-4-dehydrorhamnose reductase n=1 Tax=Pseudochelatococcus contaminans TaxID=1538103 RepID=A0A7W5Z3L7_9HYPH|nr:dTDP-4-dehydrorhamnose reductase [Pseudochelatococcus contaminans]MBB3809132.1 dTDP-4-dehydrorhamnose reductase [Pseudochelatococcus contaminans]